MSDTPKKRDSNYDLERAEQKLIAAGQESVADAMYDYTQALRNFVQGDFGQSFIDAYESVLVKHIGPLQTSDAATERILGQVLQSLDTQRGLVEQILTMVNSADKTARRALAVSKENGRGLKKLQGEVATIVERLDADELRLDRKRAELDDHDERLRRLEARAAALSQEEVARLIAVVRRMAEEPGDDA